MANIEVGKFKDEIIPIAVSQRKGDPIIVDTDVPDTSMVLMANLRPAFRKGGTVIAASSSGINDGVAALLLSR